MNIYLDIDGVLLHKGGAVADHLEEFLGFILKKHNVFWLTTYCRGGENKAIEHITQKNVVSEKTLELLKKIKPTDWNTFKTEAIDFSLPFVWIDDYIMNVEKKVLLENNALACLYEVNVNDKPDLLTSLMSVDFSRLAVYWQRFDFEIFFDKKEFELIKKGFHSNKGMDERWRFDFYDDTLYIMRHRSGSVEYLLRFKEKKGRYFVYVSYKSNLVKQKKDREFTLFEKNFHRATVIWLIENYLLGNKRDFLFDCLMVYASSKIPIDSIHAYNHWKNVEKIGHYIADKNGADKKVISAFAFLHDIGRTIETEEVGHGEKSTEIIKKSFKIDLNNDQYEKLLFAVSKHDRADAKSDDITIQTCWDADRLDLPRVSIPPDKKFLYTEIGKAGETFDYFNIKKLNDKNNYT